MTSQLRSLCLALLLPSCASSPYPDVDEPMPPGVQTSLNSPPPELRDPPPTVDAGPAVLQRADVERVVDSGLGRFLAHVQIEPSLSAGKFQGWNIVALRPPELWRGIDLQPGDVVTRVNGMPIERDTEAYAAFQAVRGAPQLEIAYRRQNQARTLVYTIVGKPSPAIPQQPPKTGS